jgi:DNA-binding response OmpR family regulator
MTALLNLAGEVARVLVVDADDEARRLFASQLTEVGYEVREAANAPSALRAIHSETCDLVMLDCDLPGIDGLALCRLLRARPMDDESERITLIVVSDDLSARASAYDSGADDFLPKDMPRPEVIARIRLHLKAAERARLLAGSNRELSFLADLGRGLLQTLEPLQVMRRVAGATFEAVNPALCAAAMLDSRIAGQTFEITDATGRALGCVFDREGSAEELTQLLNAECLAAWLETNADAGELITDEDCFLVRDANRKVEYVAPLRFGERTFGALVAGFDTKEECDDTARHLIESAAQFASFAAHISTLYTRTADAAYELTREVERRTSEAERERRFTEAIIDSLPVSLYAIDRDYRIRGVESQSRNGRAGCAARSRPGSPHLRRAHAPAAPCAPGRIRARLSDRRDRAHRTGIHRPHRHDETLARQQDSDANRRRANAFTRYHRGRRCDRARRSEPRRRARRKARGGRASCRRRRA